jgi:hypothetical protein
MQDITLFIIKFFFFLKKNAIQSWIAIYLIYMIRNSLSTVLFIDEHKKIVQRNTQEVGKMVESRFISIHPRKEWIANVIGVASSRRMILFYFI